MPSASPALHQPWRSANREERAEVLRVTVDRHPTVAAGVPERDLAVDIVDANRIQGDPAFIQPVKEKIDRVAANENRLLGPAPLPAHPAGENRNLVSMSVQIPESLQYERVAAGKVLPRTYPRNAAIAPRG